MKTRAPLTFRGVVYSTGEGRMCPACGRPLAQCACGRETARPAGDGIVRVGRQVQGRKGKGVTVITGVPLVGEELQALVTQLKKRCGSGGTVSGGVIEIQGDHRDLLVGLLQSRGWTVKRSGG
jgi:translation initiation factor 1